MSNIFFILFLGPLGIHKFKEKKWGIGLLYLFTGGLFGIGWIYDLVKAIKEYTSSKPSKGHAISGYQTIQNIKGNYSESIKHIFELNSPNSTYNKRIPDKAVICGCDMLLKRYYEIVSDCHNLINITENTDTFISRLDLLFETLYKMQKYEPFITFKGKQPSEYISVYLSSKDEITKRFIDRRYAKAEAKANTLKTKRGEINQFRKVYNEFNTYSSTINTNNDTPIQYIKVGSCIQRTDGKPIFDEEIPYLMQLGYENSLQKEGMSGRRILDDLPIDHDLPRKRIYTTIPPYQELQNIPLNVDYEPILSTDIFFLKYLDGRTLEHPDIAQYWYYDYNLNYSDEIKKLISAGLLTITNINLKKFKIEDLKNILRQFNLPLSGKKAILQKRILENISFDELSSFLDDSTHYFSATDNGSTLIETIPDSATFNLELENEAISLIMKDKYQAAYDLIQEFKNLNPFKKSQHLEYQQYEDDTFHSIMESQAFFYTLEKDRDLEVKIRASIIFCRMYGSGQDNIRKIIKRIYLENNREFTNDAKNIINSRLL